MNSLKNRYNFGERPINSAEDGLQTERSTPLSFRDLTTIWNALKFALIGQVRRYHDKDRYRDFGRYRSI